ncbi:MAG: L-Ala-D/L-Glu epimerase [Planctomycetes bacterium ADurb.Bin401]|nr:MAG: L-Ala-D/L-Glu epimerase [Planctomycetes bacterium ADurb.Bin401]
MIDVKIKKLHLKNTWTIARNSSDYKENIFIKIERNGITGFGEAAPNVRYGQTAELTIQKIKHAEKILDKHNWFQFAEIKESLDNEIQDQSCAKAAIDMAILDWVGKSLKTPLYEYWGLNPLLTPITSFSIGIDTPDILIKKIEQASEYPVLKIKVGKDNEKKIVEAVRRITDKPLRIDANEAWTAKEEALEKILWMQEQNIEFIEQPMPSDMIDETAWLRERIDIPIVADESVKTTNDIAKLAEAFDGINIKLMKSGGLLEAKKMIEVAHSLGMKVMLGCMIESSLAITAAAHLSPCVEWADLDGHLLISNDPFAGVKVENGRLILDDSPGLGINGDF